MNTTPMRDAVLYARFSPRPDSATSESIEVQIAGMMEYCAKNNLNVVAMFDDPDRSGADIEREGLWDAIDQMKKGMVLVVYQLDRLARNSYLAEQIFQQADKEGWTIETTTGQKLTDNPESKLLRSMLAAFDAYTRQVIAYKTKRAMRTHQRNGRMQGSRCPYGWKPHPDNPAKAEPGKPKLMVKDDYEQHIIDLMMSMVKEGKGSHVITRELNEAEIPAANGGKWYRSAVEKIIERHLDSTPSG